MIQPSSGKSVRSVAIADHLWEALDQMAREMGGDRDSLVNQAVFTFARLNGFLNAGGGVTAGSREARTNAVAAPLKSRELGVTEPPAPRPKAEEAEAKRKPPEPPKEAVAEAERRRTADRAVEEGALEEELIQDAGSVAPVPATGKALYLMGEDGSLDQMAKERFVIGRGKHCDFVIESGKVSREHAVIVREGEEYFIEDLGSSNGTWFNKQKIKRRKILDGDEFFICSEKLKCVIR